MNFNALMLEMAVALLALLILVADLLMEPGQSRRKLGYLAIAGLTGVLLVSLGRYGLQGAFFNGLFLLDDYALFFKQTFLIGAILVCLFSLDTVDNLPHSRAHQLCNRSSCARLQRLQRPSTVQWSRCRQHRQPAHSSLSRVHHSHSSRATQ